MRVAIAPSLSYLENAGVVSGGILPIIRALYKWLPKFGIEVTENPAEADVFHSIATGEWGKSAVYTNQGVHQPPFWQVWQEEQNEAIRKQLAVARFVTSPSIFGASMCKPYRKDVVVIHNGIDLAEWEPGEIGKYILWAKSAISCEAAHVGWERAAEVARLMSETDFVFTLWEGEVPSNVKVIGTQTFAQMSPWIRGAAAYLLTTPEVGAQQTIEAMACGVPVAGLPIGCNPEYVRNELDGVLSENLAEAIRMVLGKRNQYGRNARDRAAEFRWKDIIPKYAELYRKAGV